MGSGRYPVRCNQRHTNADGNPYSYSYSYTYSYSYSYSYTYTYFYTYAYTWTDHAQRQGEKGGGNKYIASQLERRDLKQCRRQPQWNCDRGGTEHGDLC